MESIEKNVEFSLDIAKKNIEAFLCCFRAKFKDWKENNISIMKTFFQIVIKLASLQEKIFTVKAVSLLIKLIMDKIGDTKFLDLPCYNN